MADVVNVNQGDFDKSQVGAAPNAPNNLRDADLHDNGSNPFASGAPPVDLEQPSAFPQGGPPMYYVPLPRPEGGNPHSDGVQDRYDTSANAVVADSLSAVYAATVDNLRGTGVEPTTRDYARDKGIDDQTIPPNERR